MEKLKEYPGLRRTFESNNTCFRCYYYLKSLKTDREINDTIVSVCLNPEHKWFGEQDLIFSNWLDTDEKYMQGTIIEKSKQNPVGCTIPHWCKTGRILESKMYSQRTMNIPVFRGCAFGCVYCSFKRLIQMNKKCPDCAQFKPHSHMEVLQRRPPRTKDDEFLTVGLAGDISFMKHTDFQKVLDYCDNWHDRTFLIQSKNPEYFAEYQQISEDEFPANVILGTTIESDTIYWSDWIGIMANKLHHYRRISQAPYPEKRYEAMRKLTCKKAVTIEPLLDFDLNIMVQWITEMAQEFCYVGYCNDGHEGKRLKLPEPSLEKTQALISKLRTAGINVREKTLRKAWWE